MVWRSVYFTLPNFMPIGQKVTEISWFLIFQDGVIRHLGCLKNWNFKCWHTLYGQILCQSVKLLQWYDHFLFFNMAAIRQSCVLLKWLRSSVSKNLIFYLPIWIEMSISVTKPNFVPFGQTVEETWPFFDPYIIHNTRCISKICETERFQTAEAEVTFKVTKGHQSSCHSLDHILFLCFFFLLCCMYMYVTLATSPFRGGFSSIS